MDTWRHCFVGKIRSAQSHKRFGNLHNDRPKAKRAWRHLDSMWTEIRRPETKCAYLNPRERIQNILDIKFVKRQFRKRAVIQ
jgi:hypothetical protein